MSMISRGLEQELLQSAGEMPVLTLTGPRQSGKTTLVRACFPDYEYVTLENPDVRREFMDDPRYFLFPWERGTSERWDELSWQAWV